MIEFFEGIQSRRGILTAGLGFATAGALATRPDFFADAAEAAPQDVKGSSNIVVKAFSNKKGQFRLYADGSIVDAEGVRVSEPRERWAVNPRYKKPQPERGKPSGSPWVAVDVVQDGQGTHVLFADGTVRTPNPGEDHSAPPVGQLQTYTFFRQAGAGFGQFYGRGLTETSSNRFQFEIPFREPPMFMLIDAVGEIEANYYATDHPGAPINVTTTHFDAGSQAGNFLIIFVGEVEVEES